MADQIVLDEWQRAVAEADAEARLIVTAAAGQGKTEVVLARIRELKEQGLDTSSELVVLSFSRAAVDVVQRRSISAALHDVEVRTFDSFASKVLTDEGEDPALPAGFDARVRAATALIVERQFEVDHLRHVVLDEVQDLVGDRAEMVLALLKALEPDTGFTMLGDPLQGIYDFQLESDSGESTMTSTDFLAQVSEDFGAEEVQLSRSYRARSERTISLEATAAELRALARGGSSADTAHGLLDAYRFDGGDDAPYVVSDLKHLDAYLSDLDEGETTAVLASTNYEALRISEQLAELEVPHVVRRRTRDVGAAPWVATLLRSMQPRKYSKVEFGAILAESRSAAPPEAWAMLKELEGDDRDHRTLDLQRLVTRLRFVGPGLDLVSETQAPVTVSTVHRAKGLEFDHVIDVQPSSGSPSAVLDWPNLRRKYVAASRPRDCLFVLRDGPVPPASVKTIGDRLVEYRFAGRRPPRPCRLELLDDDIDATEASCGALPDPEGAQRFLASADLEGASVRLELEESLGHEGMARYQVKAEGSPALARTDARFGQALKQHLIWVRPGQSPRWPKLLTGARVTAVDTVAGDAESLPAPTARGGLWLVPRLSGLIRPQWNSDEDEEDSR